MAIKVNDPFEGVGHVQMTDEFLIKCFVEPNMLIYFQRKCMHLSADVIERQLAELLKFLILVAEFPGNIIFGKEIDELWHLWIMQTRQYAALCAKLPGGEFRHHSSREYPEGTLEVIQESGILDTRTATNMPSHGGFEQNAKRLLSFFASYYRNFGPIRADNIAYWPPLQRLSDRLGWDAEKLNAFLREQVQKSQARVQAAE